MHFSPGFLDLRVTALSSKCKLNCLSIPQWPRESQGSSPWDLGVLLREPEETETTGPECDPLALQGCVSIQFASQLNVRHIPFKEDSILFYSL